jgi:electron transfer flavoprotein alpha subunit
VKGILVVIDTIDNRPQSSAFELLTFAVRLASIESAPVRVVIAGNSIGEATDRVALLGYDVIVIEDGRFRFPNPDLLVRCVSSIIESEPPRFICFHHTMRGCQTAAALSVRTGAPCITAVESFSDTDTGPSFTRALFNGKINIDLSPGTGPAVLTVLPGAFPAPEADAITHKRGEVKHMKADCIDSPYLPVSIADSSTGAVRLEDADVIVSAGQGIGSKENLDLIHAVASIFPNAAVGASRIVCDRKWLPYGHQVGVTGKTVAPKLYLACGISGAQQHIAGMKGSQMIVAINRDPKAAIFDISDYIIVEDLTKFLPALVQKYKEIYP